MKRNLSIGLLAMIGVCSVASNASADLTIQTSTSAGASIHFTDTPVNFNFGSSNPANGSYNADYLNYTANANISSTTLNYTSAFDISSNNSELLIERFTNQTGASINSLTISLSGGSFASSSYPEKPAYISAYSSTNPTIYYANVTSGGTLTESPDGTSITYSFSTPLATGSAIGLYAPIINLNSSGGSVTLTETAAPNIGPLISTPEPSTAIMAIGAIATCLGYVLIRRGACRMAA